MDHENSTPNQSSEDRYDRIIRLIESGTDGYLDELEAWIDEIDDRNMNAMLKRMQELEAENQVLEQRIKALVNMLGAQAGHRGQKR